MACSFRCKCQSRQSEGDQKESEAGEIMDAQLKEKSRPWLEGVVGKTGRVLKGQITNESLVL